MALSIRILRIFMIFSQYDIAVDARYGLKCIGLFCIYSLTFMYKCGTVTTILAREITDDHISDMPMLNVYPY